MLIQLRVDNHRSFAAEQVLSLTAASSGDERVLRSPALSEAVLPAVAIYGANASGKTNVLHALSFMRDAVSHSYRHWEPDSPIQTEPFALSTRRDEPSLYEVQFVSGGIRFRYGFVLSAARIEEEWLDAWPNGHKQMWFEREGSDFKFGRLLLGDNEAIRKLTRPNSLFLSAAAQNNHEQLTTVFSWFRAIQVDIRRSRVELSAYPFGIVNRLFTSQLSLFPDASSPEGDRKAILDLLRLADTGIIDVRLDDTDGASPFGRTRRRVKLRFLHQSVGADEEAVWLPLEVQSSGTVALMELAPMLLGSLGSGGLVCIDELESSLHPMLAMSLLGLFNDPKKNRNSAQLLFTTHDTSLLGRTLGSPPLNRDQIWFAEKDAAGASHLYPLTDFHPRKQENLERGYLQGRYGAIPFVGELEPPLDAGPQEG